MSPATIIGLKNAKAMEVRMLLEGVAATWFIQQQEYIKRDWHVLKALLIQNFTHQNITQTALQQLNALKQQQFEPVAQFAVKMTQLLLRADPTKSEDMKLFFLWPRLHHDISRRFEIKVQPLSMLQFRSHSVLRPLQTLILRLPLSLSQLHTATQWSPIPYPWTLTFRILR